MYRNATKARVILGAATFVVALTWVFVSPVAAETRKRRHSSSTKCQWMTRPHFLRPHSSPHRQDRASLIKLERPRSSNFSTRLDGRFESALALQDSTNT
jgi:hypothetical protein